MHKVNHDTDKKGWALVWGVIKWRFRKKKWKGRDIFYRGKMRTVKGESYGEIWLDGITTMVKKNTRYIKNA